MPSCTARSSIRPSAPGGLALPSMRARSAASVERSRGVTSGICQEAWDTVVISHLSPVHLMQDAGSGQPHSARLTPESPADTVSHDGPSIRKVKREAGARCSQRRRCPRNCKRRALAKTTGISREGGDQATTREPGDLPSGIVLWRRRGGVHRTGASLAEQNRRRDPTKLVLPGPGMDRDISPDESPSTVPADRPVPVAASGAVTVSVCITCKTADGEVVGPAMFAAVKAAIGGLDTQFTVRPVQCLSVCKRPATVAVSSEGGYTFLFGDLETESGTAALTGVRPILPKIRFWPGAVARTRRGAAQGHDRAGPAAGLVAGRRPRAEQRTAPK